MPPPRLHATRLPPEAALSYRTPLAAAPLEFEDASDSDTLAMFTGIVARGAKNNTYKFALARFLLDHSARHGPEQVRYTKVAREFLRYYWAQECKARLRQGPANQRPKIVRIIRDQFPKDAYPQTFDKLAREEPDKVEECTKKITKVCFNDVVPRFQKVGGRERKIFYEYFATEYHDSADNKRVDSGGGILVNRAAMRVLERNYAALHGIVILEWARFLEKRNFGSPNMINKVECAGPGRRDQRKFLRILGRFFERCFYCGSELDMGACTHVDHVIPYDYMGDTELCNLVLACQKCNCEKLGSLPPREFFDRPLARNSERLSEIPCLEDSVGNMSARGMDMKWHYANAKRHGYPVWRGL